MNPTLFEYLISNIDERQRPLSTSSLLTASPLSNTTSRSTPSSSQKKKRSSFRYGPRDSLRSRMKIGRPGSRRYRHWENEFFLLKNLSETESEYESEYSDDWDEAYAPSYGPFAVVFEEENRSSWEPFIDTTEEQQNVLLSLSADYVEDDDSFKDSFEPISASEAFALLCKRSQRTLRQYRDNLLLQQIDNIIFAFTNGLLYHDQFDFLRPTDSEDTLIFKFSEKFHRLLLHSVCEYYDLVSHSMDTDATQERITVVFQGDTSLRTSSLLQFLSTLD